MTQQMLETRT